MSGQEVDRAAAAPARRTRRHTSAARESVQGSPAAPGRGHTLAETERAVAQRLAGLSLDMAAMAAVQNVYRAAGAIRNHLERTVLAPYELTWTGWVVLWVVWIWDEVETRHVATEAGISKGTLTGVASTLQSRGLLRRRTHPDDARRVLLSLTPKGTRFMTTVFPRFNEQESFVTADLTPAEVATVARALRTLAVRVEAVPD